MEKIIFPPPLKEKYKKNTIVDCVVCYVLQNVAKKQRRQSYREVVRFTLLLIYRK